VLEKDQWNAGASATAVNAGDASSQRPDVTPLRVTEVERRKALEDCKMRAERFPRPTDAQLCISIDLNV